MAKVKTVVPVNPGDARRSVARYGQSPRTAAVPLVTAKEYGTQAWHDARRPLIGASEIAAVLGVSPYASPFSLWWSKQEGWDVEPTLSMRLGHELEPIIARLFGEQRPDLMICPPRASLWRHPTIDFIGCSPDYLALAAPTVDGAPPVIEPCELKSDEGGGGWGRPGTAEVPRHHAMQVIQQCMVLGSARGHLVRMAGKRFTAYEIPIDDDATEWFTSAVDEARAFVTSLEVGVPPEVDGHQATTDTLERIHPGVDEAKDQLVPDEVAAEYDRLRVLLKTEGANFGRVQNLIRELLGDAKTGLVSSTGRAFVERRVYKRRGYEVQAGLVDALYPVHRKAG